MPQSLTPPHENLRRAVQWLSDHGSATPESIEQASLRFDLSPEDEQFLLTHFLDRPRARRFTEDDPRTD